MARRKRILVVDDERDLVELICMNLQRNGYDTVAAHDGPTGLEIARKQKPDLVVLDVMMPGLSGREVAVTLKGDPDTAAISPLLRSLLKVAAEVQAKAAPVSDEAIAAARAEGATDTHIHDTVLISAAFAMFNRYVNGLATDVPSDPAFYGVAAANVCYLPIANALKRSTTQEASERLLMIEGVLSIQSGDNPRILAEKLWSFLPPEQRDSGDEAEAQGAPGGAASEPAAQAA